VCFRTSNAAVISLPNQTSLTRQFFAAAQVGAVLPSCMQLASRIMDAGESVVANNARCTDLVQHVSFIDSLLHRLQSAMAR
jgi:hypothetical protein